MLLVELLRISALSIPPGEAELLVLAALADEGEELSRFELHTSAQRDVSSRLQKRVGEWVRLRIQGVPLQHLTRRQVFLDHEYEVGPEVLIPRPETEVLVTHAIAELRSLHSAFGPALGWEVGVGSGILSIELLYHFQNLHMIASEVSTEAVAVARRNLKKTSIPETRLEIVCPSQPTEVLTPFFKGAPGPDFVISNPPYLLQGALEATSEVALYEPKEALYAPQGDPLFFYRRIAREAAVFRGGRFRIFLELPHERSAEIAHLFRDSGWEPILYPDLNGRSRVLIAQ